MEEQIQNKEKIEDNSFYHETSNPNSHFETTSKRTLSPFGRENFIQRVKKDVAERNIHSPLFMKTYRGHRELEENEKIQKHYYHNEIYY